MVPKFLALPEVDGVDIDDAERIRLHAEVLASKPMLQHVFRECHELFMATDLELFRDTPGLRVEIGAGVSPVRSTFPDVLATDVVDAPGLDQVLDAQDMSFDDQSVRAVYAQNCFHHLPKPRAFFSELRRVISPGGGCLMIEPHDGPIASLIYPRLFASEGFDKKQRNWELDVTGPMSGANQALPYVVFKRDKSQFQREFPELELVSVTPVPNALRYLLSGGLNFRQLVPARSERAIGATERAMTPFASFWAIHQMIAIRRRADM